MVALTALTMRNRLKEGKRGEMGHEPWKMGLTKPSIILDSQMKKIEITAT